MATLGHPDHHRPHHRGVLRLRRCPRAAAHRHPRRRSHSRDSRRSSRWARSPSWKQMLTTVAPGRGVRRAPASCRSCWRSWSPRSRHPSRCGCAHVGWALLPAGVLLMLVIALGTPEPAFPLAAGPCLRRRRHRLARAASDLGTAERRPSRSARSTRPAPRTCACAGSSPASAVLAVAGGAGVAHERDRRPVRTPARLPRRDHPPVRHPRLPESAPGVPQERARSGR